MKRFKVKTEVKTYASGNYDFNVDLTVGKTINYNGYQTHQYSLSDGTVVYCLEPGKANPSNGQYTASVSNDALLSAVAYYGYGGPGYESDKGIKNMVNLMDIDAYSPFHRNTDI